MDSWKRWSRFGKSLRVLRGSIKDLKAQNAVKLWLRRDRRKFCVAHQQNKLSIVTTCRPMENFCWAFFVSTANKTTSKTEVLPPEGFGNDRDLETSRMKNCSQPHYNNFAGTRQTQITRSDRAPHLHVRLGNLHFISSKVALTNDDRNSFLMKEALALCLELRSVIFCG